MASSISSRLIPSRMSGLLAIDFNVTWGTLSYTNPCLTSFVTGASLGTTPVNSDSLARPSSESARR